jgi:hypothetical protein
MMRFYHNKTHLINRNTILILTIKIYINHQSKKRLYIIHTGQIIAAQLGI